MIRSLVKKHDLLPENRNSKYRTNFDDYYEESAQGLSPEVERLRKIVEMRQQRREEEDYLRLGLNNRLYTLDKY